MPKLADGRCDRLTPSHVARDSKPSRRADAFQDRERPGLSLAQQRVSMSFHDSYCFDRQWAAPSPTTENGPQTAG
jgi:hypothetical protein